MVLGLMAIATADVLVWVLADRLTPRGEPSDTITRNLRWVAANLWVSAFNLALVGLVLALKGL